MKLFERKYYLPEMAEMLGVKYITLWHRIFAGETFPKPEHRHGKRWYYTEAEFQELVRLYGRK